jgi:polygalacturonase
VALEAANSALNYAGAAAASAALASAYTPVAVNPEFYGALGNGTADDTAALQEALDKGKQVQLRPGKTYRITSRLVMPDNSALLGDGTATIFMPNTAFANAVVNNKYQTNSCGIDVSGELIGPFRPKQNVTIRGIRLQYQTATGRFVDGVVSRNVRNLRVEDCEIFGFPTGAALRLNTLSGQSIVARNHIHDLYDNVNWGGWPQAEHHRYRDRQRPHQRPGVHGLPDPRQQDQEG